MKAKTKKCKNGLNGDSDKKVVIYVCGGVVQQVCSNFVPLDINVFDVDNKKADGMTDAQISKEWETVTNDMKIVY